MIILTHGYFLSEDEREQKVMKPYAPLGLLSIAAYLDQQGLPNDVYDSTFSDTAALQQYLKKNPPQIVGIYVNLMTKLNVIRLMEFIKSSFEFARTKIILGGPELRNNAEAYLSAGADLLVVGEGEITFAEVCEYILDTGHRPEHLPGTAVLDEAGRVQINPERALIRDIDTLPFPARHKIDLKAYGRVWKKHHGAVTLSMSTMRGCPYTCKWCSRAVYGGSYRRRSPRLVVQEMQILATEYGVERIWFVDDVFTISHRWLRTFADELKQQGVLIPYEIITRADRMNEEVIRLLKESGCFRVWIGAESGSQDIIDAMDRRVDVNNVREMIVNVKEAGMEAGTFIMLGYPGEGWKEIRETISHLVRSKPSHFTITLAYPIAGTPLFDEVKSTLVTPGSWQTITDRDYDFKRRYSTRFYKYAIRWVNHSVLLNRSEGLLKKSRHAVRAYLAQALMLIS
jgi:anaerobic magnesium-protoporphyrin IX monomethyl ester cyclase